MKDEILRLRNSGKTYSEIQKELGCSKGTIAYHCGENQKEKSNIRTKKRRELNPLLQKLDKFQRRDLKIKSRDFTKNNDFKLTIEEVISKIGDDPTCYLTGRKINLNDPSSFHFDHIIPLKLKGNSTLENLGITCKEANMAKSDLTKEEFIQLCKDVLENNGYKIQRVNYIGV